MSFITFLSLQVLLMSAYVFGAESSESEEIGAEDMKILLCDEKNAEVSKIIIGCFDEMSLPEYSSIIIQCYAGLNGEINGQAMRDWYCANTVDEIMKADECSDELMIAEKGEEFLKESAELLGECVESKLPSDKRRK
ncbi:hypothetical protein AVEN_48689-1 [Araneus ventricosus]|uniref:DUF19 domain-containing protein n=1 Tax=Araneus ventricosus TaxID=182803 RepID=A0A4Y2G0K8_ARAVE|nr:hypothetical protein AVEN_48689-1 [Araneus ventricosus]